VKELIEAAKAGPYDECIKLLASVLVGCCL